MTQLAHMCTEKTLAHRDLAPNGFDEFLLGDETLGVGRQVAQDREGLATNLDLLWPLPESLVPHVEAKGWEYAYVASTTLGLTQHGPNALQGIPRVKMARGV